MKRLDRLAWLLDSSVRIPGTDYRIGLDGLIGLIPGIGDLIASTLSGYILLHAIRMGMPMSVIIRMLCNILLELTVGTIPVFGDLFDFAFKANERNVRLMHAYLRQPKPVHQASRKRVAIVVLVLIAMLAVAFWAILSLLIWLVGLFG